MSIRLDFIDGDDLSCRLCKTITDFSAIHVGLKHHDQYLLPTRKGLTHWVPTKVAERFLGSGIKYSFELIPIDYYPSFVEACGMNHELSPLWWRILTEWPHYLKDSGFRVYTPPRTNCVSVVSNVMSIMGIDTKATTPRFLYQEMRLLSLTDGSGVIPYVSNPITHPSPTVHH